MVGGVAGGIDAAHCGRARGAGCGEARGGGGGGRRTKDEDEEQDGGEEDEQ